MEGPFSPGSSPLVRACVLAALVLIRVDVLDPTYLLKAVQGFKNQGISIYAISVQVS